MNKENILKHLDNVIEEMIIDYPATNLKAEQELDHALNFQGKLDFIKRKNVIAKATIKKGLFNQAKELLVKFLDHETSRNILKKLMDQPKYQGLNFQLYNNFKETSEEDKIATLSDQKLLELLQEVKEKLDGGKAN